MRMGRAAVLMWPSFSWRRELIGGLAVLFGWLPAQDGLARGAYFIQTPNTRSMRRGFYQVGSFRCFQGDRLHRINEQVQFLDGFGFGRLDHQRTGNDQRKGGRVGMKAIVDKAL